MATNPNIAGLPANLLAALNHGVANPASGAGGGRMLPPGTHVLALGKAPTRLTGTRQGTGSTPNAYAALKHAIANAGPGGLTVAAALQLCQAMGNPGFVAYALQQRTTKQGQAYAWFTASAPKASK